MQVEDRRTARLESEFEPLPLAVNQIVVEKTSVCKQLTERERRFMGSVVQNPAEHGLARFAAKDEFDNLSLSRCSRVPTTPMTSL